jgi:hypothetical protein
MSRASAPGSAGPADRRDQGPLIAALVAIVTVVLAAAGTVAFLATRSTAQPAVSPAPAPTALIPGPGPTPIPTPTPTPQTEAAEVMAISQLLTNSGSSRTILVATVGEVASCLNADDDVSELNQVISGREGQLAQAQSLQVDAISDGTALQDDLVTALMASLTADRDYLAWGQEENDSNRAGGETSQFYNNALQQRTTTTRYDNTLSDDQTATTDEAVFEQLWAPLAQQFNHPRVLTSEQARRHHFVQSHAGP